MNQNYYPAPPLEPAAAPPYQPTEAQKERAAALKRFNWLYLYGPIYFSIGIVLVLLVLMLITAVFLRNESTMSTRNMLSGTADVIMILGLIPCVLVCPLTPIAILGGLFYARQEGYAPIYRLQQLFWRLQAFLGNVDQKTDQIVPKVADPVIKMNGIFAYIASLFHTILTIFGVKNEPK